jgi:ankyrin repeat protein
VARQAGGEGWRQQAGRRRCEARRQQARGREARGQGLSEYASPFDAIRRNDLARFRRITRADLEALDEGGRSVLFVAILHGRAALVQRLIARGAAVDARSPQERAPLLATALRNRPREARQLLAAGARPDRAIDRDGDPVLVAAAFRECIGVVRALLSVPHAPDVSSLALLEATGVGHLGIVKLLVKHGADPHWKSARGNSAMSIARKKGRSEIVRYFRSLETR